MVGLGRTRPCITPGGVHRGPKTPGGLVGVQGSFENRRDPVGSARGSKSLAVVWKTGLSGSSPGIMSAGADTLEASLETTFVVTTDVRGLLPKVTRGAPKSPPAGQGSLTRTTSLTSLQIEPRLEPGNPAASDRVGGREHAAPVGAGTR